MTLQELFQGIASAGVQLSAVGGRLSTTGTLPPALAAGLAEHRGTLLETLGIDPETQLEREGIQQDGRLRLAVEGPQAPPVTARDQALASADRLAFVTSDMAAALFFGAVPSQTEAELAKRLPTVLAEVEALYEMVPHERTGLSKAG